MMRPNPLRRALDRGGLVVGHMVMEFVRPAVIQALSCLPLDFLLFDLEHTGLSLETLEPALSVCRLTGIAPVVRVPGLSGHYVSRCLDLGALGLMLPNVETPEQARAFVHAAKYAPMGGRGMALGAAHTGYQSVEPAAYARWANEEIVLIAQIESKLGLTNCAAILETPGIDVGWVGATDLSLSLGVPGQFEHPSFLEALTTVANLCRERGKGAGIQPGDLKMASRWLRLGYNVISLSTDLYLYREALRDSLGQLRAIAVAPAGAQDQH